MSSVVIPRNDILIKVSIIIFSLLNLLSSTLNAFLITLVRDIKNSSDTDLLEFSNSNLPIPQEPIEPDSSSTI